MTQQISALTVTSADSSHALKLKYDKEVRDAKFRRKKSAIAAYWRGDIDAHP